MFQIKQGVRLKVFNMIRGFNALNTDFFVIIAVASI